MSSEAGSTKPSVPEAVAPKHIPECYSVKALKEHKYLSASTGNVYACRSNDFKTNSYPMPKMFGMEKYAYTVVDIDDKRYVHESAENSRKLTRLEYDKQILDNTWRALYKNLLQAEEHLRTLPKNAPSKVVDEKKARVEEFKTNLLKFQQQKDLYESQIADIYARCHHIKDSIKKEEQLDALRQELTERTRLTYGADHAFWKTQFNVSGKPYA